jgi:hypothetical protein
MMYNKRNQNTTFIFRRVIFHIIMDSITYNSETKSVLDLTQEPVHTNDDKDLGDMEAIMTGLNNSYKHHWQNIENTVYGESLHLILSM